MPKTYADFVREALQVVPEISAAEARRLHESREGTVFLDVRESEEVRRGAIPGAVHLPRGVLEGHVEDWIPDRSTKVVCVCAAGNRSALAARTLHEMGYEDVRSLAGGMRAWTQGGHPVASNA